MGLSIITGLRYLIFAAIFIFLSLTEIDYKWLFKVLFYFTFIASILYILESLTGVQLMPTESYDQGGLSEQGFYHWGNIPPLLNIFIPISIFYTDIIPNKLKKIAPAVFLSAIFITMFRMAIVTTVLCILFVMIMKGASKRNLFALLVLVVVFLFFKDALEIRVNSESQTSNDIEAVLKGDFHQADYQGTNKLTMTYRFAWMYERFEYLSKKPIELLFGLGMITDESPSASKYHFNFGLLNANSQKVNQIRSPDIAWGNLLTCYGLLGSFFLLTFYVSLLKKLYRYRKYDDLSIILFALLLTSLLTSFSGATFSEPYFWPPIFFFCGYLFQRAKTKQLCIK
jgi:O-Antigen ligase.